MYNLSLILRGSILTYSNPRHCARWHACLRERVRDLRVGDLLGIHVHVGDRQTRKILRLPVCPSWLRSKVVKGFSSDNYRKKAGCNRFEIKVDVKGRL